MKEYSYENLQSSIFDQFDTIQLGSLRQKAICHTHAVILCVSLLSASENLGSKDRELLKTAALLHDISQFLYNSGWKNHALLSAKKAKEILENESSLTDCEIEKISQAIAHHSDKDKTHSFFDELLKDADTLAFYLDHSAAQKPSLSKARKKRLRKIAEQFHLFLALD